MNYSPFAKFPSGLGFILVITKLHARLKTISFQRSSKVCLFMVLYFCLSSFIQVFFFPEGYTCTFSTKILSVLTLQHEHK